MDENVKNGEVNEDELMKENNRLAYKKTNGSWQADGCIKYITILEYKIKKMEGHSRVLLKS
ncbi:MAG: hypothetical protein KA347_05485 [Bacteroidia bacterium]|jgi:hypothetical protein|nr:hypothetical protein [Bacteroidia bacterium]